MLNSANEVYQSPSDCKVFAFALSYVAEENNMRILIRHSLLRESDTLSDEELRLFHSRSCCRTWEYLQTKPLHKSEKVFFSYYVNFLNFIVLDLFLIFTTITKSVKSPENYAEVIDNFSQGMKACLQRHGDCLKNTLKPEIKCKTNILTETLQVIIHKLIFESNNLKLYFEGFRFFFSEFYSKYCKSNLKHSTAVVSVVSF